MQCNAANRMLDKLAKTPLIRWLNLNLNIVKGSNLNSVEFLSFLLLFSIVYEEECLPIHWSTCGLSNVSVFTSTLQVAVKCFALSCKARMFQVMKFIGSLGRKDCLTSQKERMKSSAILNSFTKLERQNQVSSKKLR